jgi:hypothetical protein
MTGRDSLARDTAMPAQTAAAMERRLLEAFAAHHGIPNASGPEPHVGTARPHMRWLLAAAAAVIVIAGTVAGSRALRHVAPQAPTPAAAAMVTTRVGPAGQKAASRASDPVSQGAGAEPRAPRVRRAAARLPGRPLPAATGPEPSRFTALPGAENMPRFESGTIVRMDVPVASLPTYGVDISRAGGDGAVEADFLVAQDGQARAIRLVTSQNFSSRSSQ